MIKIFLGNVGSGKTVSGVRYIMTKPRGLEIYTNIQMKIKIPEVFRLTPEMMFTTVWDDKKNKFVPDRVNVDFWKKHNKAKTVILDEAHNLMNSRKGRSKINLVMSDFLSLIRRVVGENGVGSGELILITQLQRKIDIIARDLATNVRFHRCHYYKTCVKCGFTFYEHSDIPKRAISCPRCNNLKMREHSHVVEIWEFRDMKDYYIWEFNPKQRTYFAHYTIRNIKKYFSIYDTRQWGDLLSEYY